MNRFSRLTGEALIVSLGVVRLALLCLRVSLLRLRRARAHEATEEPCACHAQGGATDRACIRNLTPPGYRGLHL